MKLDAESGMRFVLDGHDLSRPVGGVRPGSDLEFLRKRVWLDHETVISSRGHGVGKPGENRLAVVLDQIGFAVHQPFRSDNRTTGSLANRLVTKADSE